MEHIKNLLNKRVRQSGLSSSINNALIIEEFVKIIKEIWGEKIALKIKPLYIKNRILTIACLSTVISQELILHKREIIARINKKFNSEIISDFRLII